LLVKHSRTGIDRSQMRTPENVRHRIDAMAALAVAG
jgi:hypothetical protein